MIDRIDFTDKGIFFIINENYSENSFKYMTKFIFLKKEDFNSLKEVINSKKENIVIPIDNINPKAELKSSFNKEEKEKIPYFKISKNKVPNYGYLILTQEEIENQKRFRDILESHKNKYSKNFKKDILKEVKLVIEEINELNHYKTYKLVGISYDGKKFLDKKNFLKNEIFKEYKKNNIKSLFFKTYKKGISYNKIKKIKSLKQIDLLNILKESFNIEESEFLLDINFDGIIETYSKENLLEEIINDYEKNQLKDFIKNTIYKWSDLLLEK